jgi:beta-lactam-binding protein with PASTA domain
VRPPRVSAAAALAVAVLLTTGCSGGQDPPDPVAREVVVPDLVGLDSDAAHRAVCDAGLVIGAVELVDRTLPEVRRPGKVLAASDVRMMRPPAGARVAAGDAVRLGLAVPRNASVAMRTSC